MEVAGEGVFSVGSTLRIPVRFNMISSDSLTPALLEAAADGEILERAFVNGAFDGRMVRLQLCDVDFRTRVTALNKETGALLLDGMPFFRAIVRVLAARLRPPFLSPWPRRRAMRPDAIRQHRATD
jgi:hypothetical protein